MKGGGGVWGDREIGDGSQSIKVLTTIDFYTVKCNRAVTFENLCQEVARKSTRT